MIETYREEDADRANDEYLEVAQQTFEEAVGEGETSAAWEVIKNLKDAGFTSQATTLEEEMKRQNNKLNFLLI